MRKPADMQPSKVDAQNPTDTSSMNVSDSEPAQQESLQQPDLLQGFLPSLSRLMYTSGLPRAGFSTRWRGFG